MITVFPDFLVVVGLLYSQLCPTNCIYHDIFQLYQQYQAGRLESFIHRCIEVSCWSLLETQSGQPKGDEALLPPPINWATRPIPRSLPTTPRKPHPTIATLNLNMETDTRSLPTTPQKPQGTIATLATLNFNLETNMNDTFGPSYPQPESAGGSGPETPLSHPKYHFITAPTSSPRGRQKYYVVFVGKCVGIFAFW